MIRFWNGVTGKETQRWQSGQARIDIMAFAPDGRFFATRDDRIIQIWDAQTGKQLARIASESVYALAFSPTGRTLAGGWFGSRSDDQYNAEGAIHLWEVHTGQEIRQIKTPHIVIRPSLSLPMAEPWRPVDPTRRSFSGISPAMPTPSRSL